MPEHLADDQYPEPRDTQLRATQLYSIGTHISLAKNRLGACL